MLRRGVHDAVRLAAKFESAANLQRCCTRKHQGVMGGVLNASRRVPMLQIPPQTLHASLKGMSPVRGHGIVTGQQNQAHIRGSELRGCSVASPSLLSGQVIQLVAGHTTRGSASLTQAQTPACVCLIQSRSKSSPAAAKTMGSHKSSPASLSEVGGRPIGIGRVIQRAALRVQGGGGARSHWGRANRFDDYRSWTIVRRIERFTGREFEPDHVVRNHALFHFFSLFLILFFGLLGCRIVLMAYVGDDSCSCSCSCSSPATFSSSPFSVDSASKSITHHLFPDSTDFCYIIRHE